MDLRTTEARSLQCYLEAGPGAQSPGRGEGEGAKWVINGPLGFQLGNFQ